MREFDDQAVLTDDRLRRLLQYYVDLAAADREKWQERVTETAGWKAEELSRGHGRLLAADWIELNPGSSPTTYRATSCGRRALKSLPVERADH